MAAAVASLIGLSGASSTVYFEDDFTKGMDKCARLLTSRLLPPRRSRLPPTASPPAPTGRLHCLPFALALSPPSRIASHRITPAHRGRWTVGTMPGKEMGKWDVTPGKWFVDEEANKGLTITEDMRCARLRLRLPALLVSWRSPSPRSPPPARRPRAASRPLRSFYSITAPLDKPASSKGKDLVIQFSAKIENHQYAFCGGGYIKLLPAGTKADSFNGDDEYQIMFGPDLCGYDVSHVHLIFNHKGENLLKTDKISLEYSDKA